MDSSKKNIYIASAIALALIFVVLYLLFVFPSRTKEANIKEEPTEVKSVSEIDVCKRPFVTLTPTSNGAEIVISIENMQEFDAIEYELIYLADNPQIGGEKIQRGSTGTDVNTKEPKYKKSMLLGTASRGVSSPDKGIVDGKLNLHMLKGGVEYNSETKWDLIEAGSTPEEIKDSSQKISISMPSLKKNYFIIIADTLGVPPKAEFDPKNAALPIYGAFSIAPKFPKSATVSIELSQDSSNPVLYSYDHQESSWKKLESTYNQETKTIKAQVDSLSTFVVVSSK